MDGTVSPAVTGALPGPPVTPVSPAPGRPEVNSSFLRCRPLADRLRRCTEREGNSSIAGAGGIGAPDRIRTCDLWLRRPTLYPTELRALEWSTPGSGRNDFKGIANERHSAVLRHRHRRMPAGTVAASSLRSDRPSCARKRVIRFDDGTLDDPGAGGQGAFHSHRTRPSLSPTLRRTPTMRAAGDTHSAIRTARIRTAHLSRTAGICNHIPIVRNDPGGSREQG